MEKPKEPIRPNNDDYPKTYGKNYLGDIIVTCHPDFIKAIEKYNKQMEKYRTDLIVCEQEKFIKDIQRSSFKLACKKYFVNKK